ncbi:MAG TPA: 50S ribosomal protein L9 [Xanthomonadales bacterium]|nr:50S ribosomal protein L9 [Xanthomonadales bacterium]
MELILLEKVQNLGNLGDKVKVRSGFGRNFLVPSGKAVPATEKNIAHFEARRTELESAAQDRLTSAKGRSAALTGVVVTLSANASDEGKLYGSIGPREIAEALESLGHVVSRSEIVLGDGPIRTTGEFNVVLNLHADIESSIKVVVNPE